MEGVLDGEEFVDDLLVDVEPVYLDGVPREGDLLGILLVLEVHADVVCVDELQEIQLVPLVPDAGINDGRDRLRHRVHQNSNQL